MHGVYSLDLNGSEHTALEGQWFGKGLTREAGRVVAAADPDEFLPVALGHLTVHDVLVGPDHVLDGLETQVVLDDRQVADLHDAAVV